MLNEKEKNNLTSNIEHLTSNEASNTEHSTLDKASNTKHLAFDGVNVYHYSNEGVCSWYDFAKAIFEIKGIDIKINPIETKDYPTPAKRPYYSVLNKEKIKKDFNIEIPYWRESLKKMLDAKC